MFSQSPILLRLNTNYYNSPNIVARPSQIEQVSKVAQCGSLRVNHCAR